MTKQFTLADFNIDSTNMLPAPTFVFPAPAPTPAPTSSFVTHISPKLAFAYIKSVLSKGLKSKYNIFNHLFNKRTFEGDKLPDDLIMILYRFLITLSMSLPLKKHASEIITIIKKDNTQWHSNPLYWKYMGIIGYLRTYYNVEIMRTCFDKIFELFAGDINMFCADYVECAYTLAQLYDPDEGLFNMCNKESYYKATMIQLYYSTILNTNKIKTEKLSYVLLSLNKLGIIYIRDKNYTKAIDVILILERIENPIAYMHFAHIRLQLPQIAELMSELKMELNAHYSNDSHMQQFIAARKYKVGKCCVCFGIKRLYKHDCLNNHGVCIYCYGKTAQCPICRFNLKNVRQYIMQDDYDYDDDDDDNYYDDDTL